MVKRGEASRPSGGPVVGIDLGFTHSVVVAVSRRGKLEVIASDRDSRTTPSVVAFMDGETFIGEAAKDLPAARQVYDVKRMIGRRWNDPSVQAERNSWPFDVVEDDTGGLRIQVDVGDRQETFAPEEISAMVLRNLKDNAEWALGEPVTRAVITVPAHFNERQRQATRDAARLAGLDVLALVNGPTAAAIAYGLDKQSDEKKTVFVYDLGGGTFDVSVMVIEGSEIRVLASGGDTHLGGREFDMRLMAHCLEEIHKLHGVDLVAEKDKQSLQDLRRACESAKRKMSILLKTTLSVFLTPHQITNIKISRTRFEGLCADLFNKTVDISNQVLADAKVSPDAVDEVVLVGGSTHIPRVRTMLFQLFGGKKLQQSADLRDAVARGAALVGHRALRTMVKLKEVTPPWCREISPHREAEHWASETDDPYSVVALRVESAPPTEMALPDEILVRIFSMVEDGPTLLDSLPLVSKQWCRVARDWASWAGAELAVRDDVLHETRVLRLARAAKSLAIEPWLARSARYGSWVRAALGRSRVRLDTLLMLEEGRATEARDPDPAQWAAANDAIAHFLLRQPDLRDLRLTLDIGNLASLASVATMRRLRTLRLSTAGGLRYNGELAAGLPELRELDLHVSGPRDRHLAEPPQGLIGDLVRGARALRVLDVDLPTGGDRDACVALRGLERVRLNVYQDDAGWPRLVGEAAAAAVRTAFQFLLEMDSSALQSAAISLCRGEHARYSAAMRDRCDQVRAEFAAQLPVAVELQVDGPDCRVCREGDKCPGSDWPLSDDDEDDWYLDSGSDSDDDSE